MYAGAEQPATEVAVIESVDGTRAKVFAIDRHRATGYSWSVLPGEHTVWVRIQMGAGDSGVMAKFWSYCRLRFDAKAGVTYTVRSESRKSRGGWVGTLEAAIYSPEGKRLDHLDGCTGEAPRMR